MDKIFHKIKIRCAMKGISIKQLTVMIGMTEAGFYKSIKLGSLKVSTLQDVANILEVDISYFFTEEIENTKGMLSAISANLIEVCNYSVVTQLKMKGEKEYSNSGDFKERLVSLYKHGVLQYCSEQIKNKGIIDDFERIRDKIYTLVK